MALMSLDGIRTKDPQWHWSPSPHWAPIPPGHDKGFRLFLFQWLALKVMEAETPLCCQMQPSLSGHGTCQLHAPFLAPRLCWHQLESEASLIGSCVCGQGVMKRFSVSLCKFP